MDKTEFLTIFRTFERLDVVKQTLPTVIKETKISNAKLIVHDSSFDKREEKWNYLLELNQNNDFFLILSSNMSVAHAANMCLGLGQELFAPEYICIIEDDHGFEPGLIEEMISCMKKYYGKASPNGLLYGLFTCCGIHNTKERIILEDGNAFPSKNNDPRHMGRANACFRCAPTSHWNNVLKGHDTDEYIISNFQTSNLNMRNYFKGFTTLIVKNGSLCNYVHSFGRGASDNINLKRWDSQYTASDSRSSFKR